MYTKYRFGLFTLLTSFCLFAVAEDVRVEVNGAILDQSCSVKSSDLIKNVTFDDLDLRSFASVGSTSDAQEVTIGLEKCTNGIKNLSYQFTGDADADDPSLLQIKGSTGATQGTLATGLAIEILDSNKKSIALNQMQTLNQAITTVTYDFSFYLRYKSVKPTVTPGDASSVLYLDMFYE